MNLFATPLYAQSAAPAAAPAGQGGFGPSFIIMMILIFVIFFIFTIIPQRKRDKEHKKMIEGLQKGDKVLTIGGLYGVVTGVRPEEGIVTVKIGENCKADFSKTAIQSKVK